MHTKTPRYLHVKLSVKSILFVFSTVIFLTACGIKGPLYQTPPQPQKVSAEAPRDDLKQSNTDKNTESEMTQSTEQRIEPQ